MAYPCPSGKVFRVRYSLLLLSVLGCAQNVPKGLTIPPGTISQTGTSKVVSIVDPVLQMKAYSWTIPGNWIFDGAVMQGSSCVPGASPIFRMMSPDGITEAKGLPRLDWTWSDKPGMKQAPDCLSFAKELPATEVLKYMVGVLDVTFVREDPMPNHAEMQENIRKQNEKAAASAPKGSMPLLSKGDNARFVVKYNINSIPVEEDLSATTMCSDSGVRFGQNVTHFYSCSAWVTRMRTRQGQLESSRPMFRMIAQSTAMDQQWYQRWLSLQLQKIGQRAATAGAAIRKQGDDNMRMMQARQNQFNASQEMRRRQHEQFLAMMKRGTDMSMKRTQQSMNERSRMAGDWADYALDQQKRRDPNTGEVTKDSSKYSYTWVNESGQRYQTNDANDNPNGRLAGNWVVQQNIR